ncbi:MAG: hypothetical protein K8U03_03280 [Planctomycetia bacterium]|nr:hypothetical protein [Planctomycetia bacterium]
MFSKILPRLFAVSLLLAQVGCHPLANQTFAQDAPAEKKEPSAAAIKKPTAPLALAVPTAPPERINETDLKKMAPGDLYVLARTAAGEKHYQVAAIAQYWYVQATREGRFNLACHLARSGQVDSAFYWLQVAAIEEGVDPRLASNDADLATLRADPRWEKLLGYIQDCNKYFATAPIARTVVVLPENYREPAPIAAIVWMHGFGSNPDDFVNGDAQRYADQLNVALIGISGPIVRGPRSFAWNIDAEKDLKRVRDALAKLRGRITIEKGRIILFGFSQGAQAGLEIAVRHPDEFAGAIVFSPGPRSHLDAVSPAATLAKRGFVLSCNAGERPNTVQLTADDADWLKRAGAKVVHKAYPNVADHTFPEDFGDRFPEWVKFVLEAGKE